MGELGCFVKNAFMILLGVSVCFW